MIFCIGCMSAVKLVAYSTVDFSTIVDHAKILNGKPHGLRGRSRNFERVFQLGKKCQPSLS